MQDAEALKGKSLAELCEIGRSMGIKAQMRKQELLDRILELSARGDSSPAGAEAAQPEGLKAKLKACYYRLPAPVKALVRFPAWLWIVRRRLPRTPLSGPPCPKA